MSDQSCLCLLKSVCPPNSTLSQGGKNQWGTVPEIYSAQSSYFISYCCLCCHLHASFFINREIGVVRHVAPPTWLISNFLVRPASSWGAPGRPGTPSTQRRGRVYFLELQNDCSHEIKRCLNPGRKPITNLDSILSNRDIIFLTKVHIVKAMVFPVVMYGCER